MVQHTHTLACACRRYPLNADRRSGRRSDTEPARLPWEYDAATQALRHQFMQLREQLVPYLYTLAYQASSTGIPMTPALSLNYPSHAAAYTNPSEYTLEPDVLVAPR